MGFFSRQPKPPPEHIYVVPLAARKQADGLSPGHEIYLYYAFARASSSQEALKRVQSAVKDDGYEFIELTGRISYTDRAEWDHFIANSFDWIKDSMPTGQQLDNYPPGVVLYSPKIVRL
jgi:hypothetical protein